jgi:hypothetical protein
MEDWRRRFADWSPEPFAQVVATAGAALASAIPDGPQGDLVLDAYLRLVAEALRLGYVDPASCADLESGSPPTLNLLGRCLLDVVPRRLAAYGAEKRLGILARAWNVGEGLLRQPPWMARIANALLHDLDDLDHLAQSVTGTLEPLLTEPRHSSFAGPFSVQVVDLRDLDDEFLPGTMHVAAPYVLCVHDRLRRDTHGAVALSAGGTCRSLGTTPCLADRAIVGGKAPDEPSRPHPSDAHTIEVRVVQGRATVAGRKLALPTVHTEHAHVVVPSGFLAVSAVDSQRLWIVESAS